MDAARAPDAGQSGAGQNWVTVYTGMRGDVNRPWRGHVWTAPDYITARQYGANVRQMQGDVSGAVTIDSEAALRQALGPRADELLTRRGADVFEHLDNPAVREALRERGVSVVRLTDDATPEAQGVRSREHESYLFLDDSRLRAPDAPDASPSRPPPRPRPPPRRPQQ